MSLLHLIVLQENGQLRFLKYHNDKTESLPAVNLSLWKDR